MADEESPARMARGGAEQRQVFFGIYFAMTGLHGVHVLAGIGAIFWILFAPGAASSAANISRPSISPASIGTWWTLYGYSFFRCCT